MKVLVALFIVVIGTAVFAEQSNKQDSMVSSSYGGGVGGGLSHSAPSAPSYGSGPSHSAPAAQSYSAPAAQSYSAPAAQSYSAPATQSYPAPATHSYSAPSYSAAVSSYSAPVQPSYSAPAPVAPLYTAAVTPLSFSAPPCPRNYLLGCQPTLRPVPCNSPRPYGSIGAYSEYIPAYIVPSAADFD